jgi:hypothetical protein
VVPEYHAGAGVVPDGCIRMMCGSIVEELDDCSSSGVSGL